MALLKGGLFDQSLRRGEQEIQQGSSISSDLAGPSNHLPGRLPPKTKLGTLLAKRPTGHPSTPPRVVPPCKSV
jgi:hypothetical protein